jgi:hypothetical protein
MPKTKYDKSCPNCRDKEQHSAAETSLLSDLRSDDTPIIRIDWGSSSGDSGSSYDGGGGDYSGGGASDSWSSD